MLAGSIQGVGSAGQSVVCPWDSWSIPRLIECVVAVCFSPTIQLLLAQERTYSKIPVTPHHWMHHISLSAAIFTNRRGLEGMGALADWFNIPPLQSNQQFGALAPSAPMFESPSDQPKKKKGKKEKRPLGAPSRGLSLQSEENP